MLVEQSVDVIFQVSHSDGQALHYDYVSPSVFEVLGWTVNEMKHVTHSMVYPPAALATIREAGVRLIAGAPSTVVTLEAIRKDGRHIWVENRVSMLKDKNGANKTVVCMRDVTERKLLQDQLAQLVLVDALTGVGNRRAFDSALDREWKQAVDQKSALSLMLIDVDHFKQINDTYGHQVGDECIRRVAKKIAELLNRPEAFVARYGGDELAVLLPGISESHAREMGDGLCRGIAGAALLPLDGAFSAGRVTISCGASTALAPRDGSRRMPAGLIAAADRALYAAKSLGAEPSRHRNPGLIAEDKRREVRLLDDPTRCASG